MIRGLLVGLMLATAAVAPSAVPKEDAPLLLPAMPLHDPWIVADRASGLYRLYTTNVPEMSGDARLGTMVYTSRDLKHWSRPHVVFASPSGTWAKAGAWAPEVHRWHGRWYLLTTFHDEASPLPRTGPRALYRRGTILAVADSLAGSFVPVRAAAPVAGKARMTLDGTLYVDPAGKPWLVYAHEWLQMGDGTVEAMPLGGDLAAIGPPVTLFHASDAPWVDGKPQPEGDTIRVTDGPELFRTRTGTLLMLWSSYDREGYVAGLARSKSGGIAGPWEQLPPLLRADSGHGMLFRRFDGTLMLVVHRPFRNARGKLYEMRDAGDRVEIVREATELDGEPRDVR